MKDIHISDSDIKDILSDTNSLLNNWPDLNGESYMYPQESIKKINYSLEQSTDIQKTFTLLYNVLNILYGDGSSISEDKCSDWRENLNTGGSSSNPTSYSTGGINYPSRLTIIYDEELITRYLDTNEIDLDNTEISVLPGTIRTITLE